MTKAAIVGLGYWGPNILRVLNEINPEITKYACDLDENNLEEKVRKKYPHIKTTTDFKEILKDDEVDSVIITTPVRTHYRLALHALGNRKNVLVEKPITQTSDQALDLIKEAEKNNAKLMVDHTFNYSSPVQEIKKLMPALGDIVSVISRRMGPGKIRTDVNAMWNLMPHDLTIFTYLLEDYPITVQATGFSANIHDGQRGIEDVTTLHLEFPNGAKATTYVDWLYPEKVREMGIVGRKRSLIYDDVRKESKVRLFTVGADAIPVYDPTRDFNKTLKPEDKAYFQKKQPLGQSENIIFEEKEPLRELVEHFIDCVDNNKQPLTGPKEAYRIVKILETAQRSLKNYGQRITIGEYKI